MHGVARMKVQEVEACDNYKHEEMLDILHGQKLKDTVTELPPNEPSN